jgi:carbonic anhydrase
MRLLKELFDRNAEWAQRMEADDPGFFARLTAQQSPHFFWIGCSDSRVPAEQITGLIPGDLFVHRNVANIVAHEDLSCQAALQFAVEVLKVGHVLVVGHHGCGGVRAAMQEQELSGPTGEWLRPVRSLYEEQRDHFSHWKDHQARWDKLCELNVISQVDALCRSPLIRRAWDRGQQIAVHGWIYDLRDGRLQDLNATVTSEGESFPAIDEARRRAMTIRS